MITAIARFTNILLVGGGLTFAVSPVIGAEYSANSHRLWVPEALRPGQLKGALFCSDYAAERALYSDPKWRALATRHRLGFVKYAGLKRGGSKRVHATPDKSFLNAITDLATASGYKELVHAPVVFLGVSAAGSRLIRLGAKYPKRTIACVGYHGISIRGSSSRAMPFPILYAMAQHDKPSKKRNSVIEPYVRKVMRRDHQNHVTLIIQKGAKHSSTGDERFPLMWLDAVITQRVGNSTLKPVSIKDSWQGTYKALDLGSSAIRFSDVSIARRYDRSAETVWLPNARVAKAWLADHQTAARPRPQTNSKK